MIRKLEKDDITFVNNLINDNYYIVNEYELDKNSYVYLNNNKIVAFISFVISYERAELYYIYVDEEYRRKHIASELMEYMFDICLNQNVETVDLEVKSTNEKAINLYKKYKFEIINIRKKYYSGIDAYLMIKKIR